MRGSPAGWLIAAGSVALVAIAVESDAACAFSDSAWSRARPAVQEQLLSSIDVDALDEACLAAAITRVQSAPGDGQLRAVELVSRWSAVHGAPLKATLMRAAAPGIPKTQQSMWREVCRLAEQRDGPWRPQIMLRAAAGEYRVADTLYALLDAGGQLTAMQYLDWAATLHTARDYQGAVRALCALGRFEPRMAAAARMRLADMLQETDSSRARGAIGAYERCALGVVTDTAAFRDWLSLTYGQLGLHTDEIQTVIRFGSASRPVFDPLLRIARRHIALKRYAQALAAARPAWNAIPDKGAGAAAAAIIYEAHLRLGQRDSAGVWLERANMGSGRGLVQSIVFYQQSGALARADSLVRGLPAGCVRDTMICRQLLFMGKADSAAVFASKMREQAWWRRTLDDAGLWLARASLFSGDLAGFSSVADSLVFEPSWEYASEILGHRHRRQLFAQDASAMGAWPVFEYALYRGQIKAAEQSVDLRKMGAAYAADFARRLIDAYLAGGLTVDAARVAGFAGGLDMPPEFMYACAEVLVSQADVVRARQTLEQILLKHPSSIYASKARLLLAKVQS